MTDTYKATQNNTNLTAPGPNDGPREKDFENGYHLDASHDPDTALRKIQTSGSISISPELFEKIYLSPQNKVAGDLRKTFGGNGAASTGPYFFFGGLLMILGGLGEWILGNTFPFVVFCTFGAFWLQYAATLQPFYNSYGAYSPDPMAPGEGLTTVGFNASYAFFLLFMGVLCFLYMILALRTNLVFFLIFMFLVPSFSLLAAAFWHLAYAAEATTAGDMATAASWQSTAQTETLAAGALTFVVDMLGWYIFFAILLASLDFPFQLPVVDLSRFVKGASDRAKAKKQYEA